MKESLLKIKQNKKVRYLAIYTIIFLVVYLLGYSEFFFGHKLFLPYDDVLVQHYPASIYFGEYFRMLPEFLLKGEFPMYDFSIGLGDDIFAPLMMHSANADIFNLLFIFIPGDASYIAYITVMMMRMYFAGLTFSYYCFTTFPKFKNNKYTVMLGSLLYVFSGWACLYNTSHPAFIIALVYLPLIVAGFDKILRNEKPYIFIVSVFLLGLASFYYLYMVTVFIIIYALIRIHNLYRTDYTRNVLHFGFKSAGFYIIGFAMSAIVAIPILSAFFSTKRESYLLVKNLFLYPMEYYINSFISYPAPIALGNVGIYAQLGMAAVVPMMFIVLFFQKPLNKHLIAGVLTAFVIQNIPLGAYMLNGFAYVTNRVEFLFCFVYCIMAVFVTYEYDYDNINKKVIIALSVYALTLYRTIYFMFTAEDKVTSFLYVGVGFIALIIITLLIPADNPKLSSITVKRKQIFLFLVILLNLTVSISPLLLIPPESFIDKTAEDMFADYIDISDIVSDDDFYRQGTPFTHSSFYYNKGNYVNEAMLSGYYGISEYWSLANPAYTEFSYELENAEQAVLKWRIDGLDNRTALTALTSVKYVFTTFDNPPAGYEFIKQLPFRKLHENMYALPPGYTYDKTISASDYEALHPLDKQEVLMQAVALPDEYANTNPKDLDIGKNYLPYVVYITDNITWENGILDCSGATDAKLKLNIICDGICIGNCETYIRLIGFDTADRYNTIGRLTIKIDEPEVSKSYKYTTSNIENYHNRKNHLINIGYYEQPVSEIELHFESYAYQLEAIEVYCLPMDSYPDRVQALAEDVLENIAIGTNKVTGNISLNKDKILVFSIPYSKGWSATVNGEPMELLQANTAFMALPLTAGHYDIELTYVTPGIRIGAVISLTGFIAFTFVVVYHRKKKRPANEIPGRRVES